MNEDFFDLVGLKYMGRTIKCWCGGESKLMKYKNGVVVYVCVGCNTKHGAHQKYPYDPLGVPAEPKVRQLRRECHAAFDRWRQLRGWKRSQTYHQLALLMNMTRDECHIGLFDHDTCLRCLDVINFQGVT